MYRFSIIYIYLLVIVFVSCNKKPKIQLPIYNPIDFNSELVDKSVKNIDKNHTVANFKLRNQNGKIITNDYYKGKIQIADFFFTTCPGICPKLTKNMFNIQEYYKSDSNIRLVSFSVMPWVDKVEQLKNYSIANKVDSLKWNLLTGDKDKIYDLARNGYFADENYYKNQDKSEFIHTENFILVDHNGFIRGVYNGTIEFDIERLKRHILILKKEYNL